MDEAIGKIKALGTGQTLDVVLGSKTTQTVFDSKIGDLNEALRHCKGKVNLDMTVSRVTRFDGYYAFWYCTSLASVDIPSSVTSIGLVAFASCKSLVISVGDGNQNYASHNGTLYNKNKTELIAWPCASGNISIPEGVTSIGYGAFSGCSSLVSVNILSSVTSFRESAFYDCTKLTQINYAGKKNAWNTKIRCVRDWNYNVLTRGATCIDGKLYDLSRNNKLY